MERISGTVARVKGMGFQLDGHDGTWFNVSKFAEGVEVPAVGASVAVDLDGKGFVRRVETENLSAVDRGFVPRRNETPVAGTDQAATRLACLNTAATILGAGPGYPIDPAEVAKLAARLEAWATRATS